jgi:hypothetical protein
VTGLSASSAIAELLQLAAWHPLSRRWLGQSCNHLNAIARHACRIPGTIHAIAGDHPCGATADSFSRMAARRIVNRRQLVASKNSLQPTRTPVDIHQQAHAAEEDQQALWGEPCRRLPCHAGACHYHCILQACCNQDRVGAKLRVLSRWPCVTQQRESIDVPQQLCNGLSFTAIFRRRALSSAVLFVCRSGADRTPRSGKCDADSCKTSVIWTSRGCFTASTSRVADVDDTHVSCLRRIRCGISASRSARMPCDRPLA